MATKAVKISGGNQNMLAQRFAVDEDDKLDRLPLGYILVTDFGNDEYFDVITQTTFDTLFQSVETLENGFVDVVRK